MEYRGDRRRHERHPLAGEIGFRRPGSMKWSTAYAADVSMGGFGFITSTKLVVGERIHVQIPSEKPTPSIATTVRHIGVEGTRYLVGVER